MDGDPTRLLVGGTFDVQGSSGVSELSSANNVSDDQLGYLELGDVSNVSIGARGNGGVWMCSAGTTSGAEPAIHVPDRVAQPQDSVAAPGAFDDMFSGAQAQAAALATKLSSCADAVTSPEAGSHAGASHSRERALPKKLFDTTGPHRLVLISCTDRVTYPGGGLHYRRNIVVTATPPPTARS